MQSCFAAAIFLSVFAFLATACATEPIKGVRIYEARVQAVKHTSLAWLSSNQVMFIELTDEYVEFRGDRKRVRRLAVWNVETNEIRRLGAADGGLCYDRGNIAYWEHKPDYKGDWTFVGRFPNEIARYERSIKYDWINCLPLDKLPALPAEAKDRSILRLRSEHGFLDLGLEREYGNTPIKLINSWGSIELPIRRREFLPILVRYYPFKGAYFFESEFFRTHPKHPHGGFNDGWPDGKPRTAWWLYPDGRVENITIPYARWARTRLVPSKAGILTTDSTYSNGINEPPWDGVYLVRGNEVGRRLLRGAFSDFAVSDDGCRFAVVRLTNPGRGREYWSVTALDVCGDPK